MGEGRELRLGLSGARPDGACEKTTTHWPTLCVKKRTSWEEEALVNTVYKYSQKSGVYYKETYWVKEVF